ncbi:ThuA domain-containing protein [Kineococcus sp. SYSU DK001]|uniref:ThuA domain-containing protein n=1 Tax=Kineococcus sp. SYSU DK001 TaxID=3383122 RepID=UPI003D7EE3C5
MRARALVLVGRGRYQDRWHDDAATGCALAGVLRGVGVRAQVRGTAPTALDDGDEFSLLVVVAGTGRPDPDRDGDDTAWRPFHDRLGELVSGGGLALLAVHQAANTFTDAPGWASLIGGRWVPGVSTHPPIGVARFRPAPGQDHPVTAGLPGVEAFDERYCRLRPDPASTVLLSTEHDGDLHPVVWQAAGPGRVVYDGLGHDVRSYASASRRELLRREVTWLLGGPWPHRSGQPRA